MTAIPVNQPLPRRGGRSTDLPRIVPWSWLGLESVLWGLVIAHIIKWAVSFGYYIIWQQKYGTGPASSADYFTVWNGKDLWDRLVIHIQNGLPGEVAVLAGIAVAILAGWTLRLVIRPRRPFVKALTVVLAVIIGTVAGLRIALELAGWHVHWFPGQAAPAWWVTMRHDIRDVGIALVATIIVRLIFAKPKYPVDDNPGLRVYLTSIPKALAVALIPIAAVAVLAWKLPWLTQHGYKVPGNWGAWASEANGWIEAGTWITVVMGIVGGIVATRFIQRIADDIQWFLAERSAGHIRSGTGLDALRGERVYGTPSHRKRVHWLLDNVTLSDLPDRNPWLVRALMVTGFFTMIASGAGAYLNLFGAARPH